jgi:hypothetical protein
MMIPLVLYLARARILVLYLARARIVTATARMTAAGQNVKDVQKDDARYV